MIRRPPLLREDETVESATRRVLEAGVAALPVVDADERFVGIFGEREFMEALFPGYLKQLKHVRYLAKSLDEALEKRESCRLEPISKYMLAEHVEVDPDFAETEVAEVFLHHRVLVVPVVADGRVEGLITRSDFFRELAERFLSR
jgi:CBS domain-containing protein